MVAVKDKTKRKRGDKMNKGSPMTLDEFNAMVPEENNDQGICLRR